jgi:hypothetical protein
LSTIAIATGPGVLARFGLRGGKDLHGLLEVDARAVLRDLRAGAKTRPCEQHRDHRFAESLHALLQFF